jgi:ABC-type branched-subunit amino acid transport system permease subunit
VIGSLAMQAVPYDTVPAPTTPWVAPGDYTVKLTVNGKSYTQPLTVKQDPRVKTPAAVMQVVYSTTTATYYEAAAAGDAARAAQAMRDRIAALRAGGNTDKALADFDTKLADLNLGAAASGLAGVMNLLQSADVTPTAVQMQAIAAARATASAAMAKWAALKAATPAILRAGAQGRS